MAVSFVALLLIPVNFDYWVFALILLINGIGMGLFSSPNRAEVMNSLPIDARGSGAGMMTTFQNAAMVLSIGLFFSLMIAGLSQHLPSAMYSGLTSNGMPSDAANGIAHLPTVGILFVLPLVLQLFMLFGESWQWIVDLGVVGIGVLAYAAASTAHTSGFIACYLAALVLGNMHLSHRQSVTGFAEALGWLAQIGLFVMLGLLATPSGFFDEVPRAILVGLVLLLVARPLSVLVSLTPFGVPWREQAFLSWAGLRGAVPVVLATVPITNNVPGVEWVFDLVFMLVVIFTLVQAPLMPRVARALRVTEPGRAADVVVEAMPLEELGAEMLDVAVHEGSRLAGVEVYELRLPQGVNVSLVVRGAETFVPDAHTRLWTGDRLLVVTPGAVREATEARFRAVSRAGRLAGWRTDV